jgi:hypothetical protein
VGSRRTAGRQGAAGPDHGARRRRAGDRRRSGSTDTDRLADFGLATPSARLSFGRPGGAPVTLLLGSANPAETGVYGRLEGNPQIILLGLNVRYYIDLVLKQSGA